LLDWLGAGVYVERVLSEFPGYSGHVRRMPCEDIFVSPEKLDERAFLFGSQVSTDTGGLGGFSFHKSLLGKSL
jgi:hypothetical protein